MDLHVKYFHLFILELLKLLVSLVPLRSQDLSSADLDVGRVHAANIANNY